jgi:hypothetical protein
LRRPFLFPAFSVFNAQPSCKSPHFPRLIASELKSFANANMQLATTSAASTMVFRLAPRPLCG